MVSHVKFSWTFLELLFLRCLSDIHSHAFCKPSDSRSWLLWDCKLKGLTVLHSLIPFYSISHRLTRSLCQWCKSYSLVARVTDARQHMSGDLIIVYILSEKCLTVIRDTYYTCTNQNSCRTNIGENFLFSIENSLFLNHGSLLISTLYVHTYFLYNLHVCSC
jgi:hypothetical protein